MEQPAGQADGPYLYRVRVLHSSASECCACSPAVANGKKLAVGDLVIVPTRYGRELARVQGVVGPAKESDSNAVQSVERLATAQDLERFEENKKRALNAFRVCQEKIAAHKLEMKLVSAHYLMDESKILFFFTSDGRVDFRELVKDLVSVFRMRIELRQIGVRDEARVLGGIGVCGRDYCCHGITDKLKPVSIKMAKEQNLTLNSMKISGPCGRLLCCLAYEYETYCESKRNVPSEGARLHYQNELFKVTEVNIFSRKVRMAGESGRVMDIPFDRFSRDPEDRHWQVGE
jgi:cell fate regulator YaaT (PSP1 superfamily)